MCKHSQYMFSVTISSLSRYTLGPLKMQRPRMSGCSRINTSWTTHIRGLNHICISSPSCRSAEICCRHYDHHRWIFQRNFASILSEHLLDSSPVLSVCVPASNSQINKVFTAVMSMCRWFGSLPSHYQCSRVNYAFSHFTRVLNVSLFASQQMVMLWVITHQSERKWVKERQRDRKKEKKWSFWFVFSAVLCHLSLIVSSLKSWALTHLFSFLHPCSDVPRLCLTTFAFLHFCFYSPSGSFMFLVYRALYSFSYTCNLISRVCLPFALLVRFSVK